MSTANLPNTTALTQAISSAVRPGLLGRIGTWFRKAPQLARSFWNAGSGEPLDLAANLPAVTATYGENGSDARGRGKFLRPWARRDAALDTLQDGLGALSELMTCIRGSLEAQSRRQDEIVGCLANLPELIRQLPENSRSQLETLTALRQQLERQHSQQGQLADILERISQADQHQGRALDALCQHEAEINQNLGTVGTVMQSVGASATASAQVLEQLRDNIENRDRELEHAFKSQNTRLTVLLSVAISTSVIALSAVGVMGFLVVRHLH